MLRGSQNRLRRNAALGCEARDWCPATWALGNHRRLCMSDTAKGPEPAYHLFLDSEEAPVAASAMRLLIADEAHEPRIRQLAREVLASLQASPDERGTLTVPLSPEQMKIMHSAVSLLLS